MPFNCSIDLDDEWIQEDCHWKCDRYFIFTWELEGTPASVELYYRFNTLTSDTTKYKRVYLSPKTINGKSRYTLNLKLSSLTATEQKELHESGCVTIYAKNGSSETGYKTIEYDLVLPPEQGEGELLIKKEASTRFICSWPKADEAIPSAGDTDGTGISGYCIELWHCHRDSKTFSRVRGIEAEQREGVYWIKKISSYSTPKLSSATAAILEGDFTLVSPEADSEIYLPGPDSTNVYFDPSELGYTSQDFFKFKVYPYVVYSTYYDEEQKKFLPSALLGPNGVSSDANKSAGIVRVKTADGWREGVVWVKTATGWKEANAIYTKSSTGWKESI